MTLRTVIGRMHRRLRDQADRGDLSTTQVSLLGRLARDGPATVTALARGENMRPQSMGANIAVLAKAGLIVGTPDPGDGRQTIFSLTASADDWIARFRAAREDWLSRTIDATLTPCERDELGRALALVERLIES